MSAKNFMTVLEFRARYGIPNTNVSFNKALEYARAGNWRGLSLKTAFSPSGAYTYPESAMKKIARALGIPLQRASVQKDSMTVTEFRGICPGLPKVFSRNVASYFKDSGLASAETPRRYPFSILKRCAERMGYSVPDLPVATAKKQEADNAAPCSETKEEFPVTPGEVDAEFEGVDAVRCLRHIAISLESIQTQLDNMMLDTGSLNTAVKESNIVKREQMSILRANNRTLSALLDAWKGDQK